MKKIYQILKNIAKDFIFNSFWKSWPVLVIIILSLILNAVLWYLFLLKIKFNPSPFIFASGLIFLNLILGNYLWEREKIATFFLLSAGLFVQLLMLIFSFLITMY